MTGDRWRRMNTQSKVIEFDQEGKSMLNEQTDDISIKRKRGRWKDRAHKQKEKMNVQTDEPAELAKKNKKEERQYKIWQLFIVQLIWISDKSPNMFIMASSWQQWLHKKLLLLPRMVVCMDQDTYLTHSRALTNYYKRQAHIAGVVWVKHQMQLVQQAV